MTCYCERRGHCPWHKTITDQDSYKDCLENSKPPPKVSKTPCVYLAEEMQKDFPTDLNGQAAYVCKIHGKCTVSSNRAKIAACDDCNDYLTSESKDVQTRFLDPLRVTDRQLNQTYALRNLLYGRSAFLVCGGPSLKTCDYNRLAERGIFSMGINNVAGYVPVSAFTCSDPPSKFHWGIWADPNMMKFVPTPKIGHERCDRGKLRKKLKDGSFEWFDPEVLATDSSPNVWGYERRGWLMTDETWFTDSGAAWGNLNRGVKRFEQDKTVCTMLLGLRLLQYLGAKKIFLLGVDFHMALNAGRHDNYAFGEERDQGAVQSNNAQFAVTNKWLCDLRPVFERFGFHTYNCNQQSHLRAFDYVPFEAALEECRGFVPKEPFDLTWWYCKNDNPPQVG
jgi:hypothetical protein